MIKKANNEYFRIKFVFKETIKISLWIVKNWTWSRRTLQGADERTVYGKTLLFVQTFIKCDFESEVGLSIEELKNVVGQLTMYFTGTKKRVETIKGAYNKKGETDTSKAMIKADRFNKVFLECNKCCDRSDK